MSNGRPCCILGVCCPPNRRAARSQALAQEISEGLGWAAEGTPERGGVARDVAEWLMNNYDLVPHGLGTAIVEAYRPTFEGR